MQFKISLLFLITCLPGLCITGFSQNERPWVSKPVIEAGEGLRITVDVNGQEFRLHDPIRIIVRFSNIGAQPLFISRHQAWCNDPFFHYILGTLSGGGTGRKDWKPYKRPSPAGITRDDMVCIAPGEFFQCEQQFAFADHYEPHPGIYKLIVTCQSTWWQDEAPGFPGLWDHAHGVLFAKAIDIRLVE